MTFRSTSLLAATAITLATAAIAQQHPAADPSQTAESEIVVTGFAKPYKLTGKQLLRAQNAFNAQRDQFAPQSQLYFQVTLNDGRDGSGLDLYLKNGDEIVSLPLDERNRFTLPPLGRGEWTLFANHNRKGMAVTPTILSPGTSDRNRLLGDLRLQCEVYWAMSSPETSVFLRTIFAAAGGCKGTKFGYYVTTQAAIASGAVTSGNTSAPLKLWGDHLYLAPIGVKRLPNTARVVLNP